MNFYPEKSGARTLFAAAWVSICGLTMAAAFAWAGARAMGWL